MNGAENHKIYTAAEILQYLAGGMTNADMHALEKAALDDPLLAEAIEGYQGMKQQDWTAELQTLKNKLDLATNKTKPSIQWFRIYWKAAAILIVAAGGALFTYFANNHPPERQALATKSKPPAVQPSADESAKFDTAYIDNTHKNKTTTHNIKPSSVAEADNNAPNGTPRVPKPAGRLNTDSSFVYKPSTVAAPSNDKKNIAGSPANNVNNIASSGIGDELKENQAKSSSSTVNGTQSNNQNMAQNQLSNNLGFNYQAQVVTEDNKPLAFANVSIANQKLSVYTDQRGNFKIPLTDTNARLQISSAGYLTRKLYVNNLRSQPNKIVLHTDTSKYTAITIPQSKALSSVAKGLKIKDSTENVADDEEDAEPIVGWEEYNNYLLNHLVLPAEVIEKNIHGFVEVSVKLNDSGEISRLSVNKRLCSSCDAEALRLIKEGPKWEIKNPKSKKAKVTIHF